MTAFRDPSGKLSMTRILSAAIVAGALYFVPATAHYISSGAAQGTTLYGIAAVLGVFLGTGLGTIRGRTTVFPPTPAVIQESTAYVDTRTTEERQADAEGC
jgi:hypothetical protein